MARESRWIVGALIVVICLAAPVAAQEKGTGSTTPLLEQLVPEGTIMITSIPDAAGFVKEYRRTIVGQVIEWIFSKDFQAMLRHLGVSGGRGGIPDFRKEIAEGIKRETGMTFEEILAIFDGECAVAVVDVAMTDPAEGRRGPPVMADFVLKLGWKDAAKGEGLLRTLLKKAPAKEVEIAGFKTLAIPAPTPAISPTFAFTPSGLIFGTNAKTLETMLTALKGGKGIEKSLAADKEYRLAMTTVRQSEGHISFYVNLEKVINLPPVKAFLEGQAPDLVDDLGLAGVKAVASSFQVKEAQMRDIVFLRAAAGERKGLMKILSTPKTETKDGLVLTSSGDFSGLSFGGIYSPNIAIIAAIAVPSLLKSQMASNEKSAIGSLKNIRNMNAVFNREDSDRNTYNDYWTADVSGLYRVLNAAGTEVGKIEIPLALADAAPLAPIENYVGKSLTATPVPKAGYLFRAMTTDENGEPYCKNPLTDANGTLACHTSKFAFCAYPAEYEKTGKNIFIVSEEGTIWKKDTGNNEPVLQWPAANPRSAGWGTVD